MIPKLYILDQQEQRAQRLSIILNFVAEAHQIIDEVQLLAQLAIDPKAVVLLGALVEQQHEQLIELFFQFVCCFG